MNPLEKENLERLFRYHGNTLGAARTTTMALNALIDAFTQLDCEDEDLVERYNELAAEIRTLRPHITPLIHMLEQFETDIKPFLEAESSVLKEEIVKQLKHKVKVYQSRAELVVRHGIQFIEEGDSIIVHSASSVVTNILLQAKQVLLRDFSVLVLQLDPVRTPQVALSLRQAEIPHTVIPAFNLCHYVDQANKILLGAVSVTKDLQIVAPVGTSSTLSLCRYNNIKSYLFANSFHFSHGLAKSQRIHHEKSDVASSRTTYELVTHSHDLVDMDLIDVLVDEDGIVDSDRLAAFAG